jgi:hypothetical protein
MPEAFITTTQAAEANDLSSRRVQQLCKEGAIKGAKQFGTVWMVPASWKWTATKPGPKPKRRVSARVR